MKNNKSHVARCLITTPILSLSLVSPSFASGARHFDEKSPGAVIKNFYYWYIYAIEAGTDPFKKGRAALVKEVGVWKIDRVKNSPK